MIAYRCYFVTILLHAMDFLSDRIMIVPYIMQVWNETSFCSSIMYSWVWYIGEKVHHFKALLLTQKFFVGGGGQVRVIHLLSPVCNQYNMTVQIWQQKLFTLQENLTIHLSSGVPVGHSLAFCVVLYRPLFAHYNVRPSNYGSWLPL